MVGRVFRLFLKIKQFTRVKMYSDNYWGKFKFISVRPEGCWKHKFLKNEGYLSSEEKFLAFTFS